MDISNLSLNESRLNTRLKTTAGPNTGAFYKKQRDLNVPTINTDNLGFDDEM